MTTALQNTTTSEIEKTLARLRADAGLRTFGRVLTLVIMAEKGHSRKALEAAVEASHEHPCRIIMHIPHNPEAPTRLDAEINLGGEAGASEVIVLRGWGECSVPTESLLAALLLPDSPIVAWWPHYLPQCAADNSVGQLAARRITDSARAGRPWEALELLAENYVPGDTDLAWTRLTLWRIQLAAIMDQLPADRATKKVVVEGATSSPSVLLLGTWLGYRLGVPVEVCSGPTDRGLFRVRLEREDGEVHIHRPGDNIATITLPDGKQQQIPLPVRSLGQCIAEELRRLDPDEAYGEVLTTGLSAVEVEWTTEEEDQDDATEYTEIYDA